MAKFSHLEKQRRMVLLLVLFILKYKYGKSWPDKTQVTNFVSIHQLLRLRPEDRKKVSTGEEAWVNKLAWTRNDLKDSGLLQMPETGVWAITPSGEDAALKWMGGDRSSDDEVVARNRAWRTFQDFWPGIHHRSESIGIGK
jgi:hypothetical protein